MAGDAFFSKTRKRKRSALTKSKAGPSNASYSDKNGNKRPKSQNPKGGARRRKDEELDDGSEGEDDDDLGGDLDDLDLRGSDVDDKISGDEDENETPAQKRLRLAQLYLDSIRDDLG